MDYSNNPEEFVTKVSKEIEGLILRGRHTYYNFDIDCSNNRDRYVIKIKNYFASLGYSVVLEVCPRRKNIIKELMITF